MAVPVQRLLLSFPALIYAAMRVRRGGSWRQAPAELGFTAGKLKHYLWGTSALLVVVLWS